MRFNSYTFVLLFISINIHAQIAQFRAPVNIPIILNGNFGELRSTHFHGGIDIKTNGATGLPILAIEDGFVSRISVSPFGYGNAVYIEHPSGYTSVYGHLEKFTAEIAQWVKSKQYGEECFAVTLKPVKNQFVVKRGDIVAYSGNSGSSGGPHLHFEIRNTLTENPINPLLFPFAVTDKSKPSIESLTVYPISDDAQVENQTTKKTVKVVRTDKDYALQGSQDLKVYGDIGFGIEALDYLDGSWSKCGIYKIELSIDGALYHRFTLDSLDYETNIDYYSHIDYALKLTTGKQIHRCFVDPGNRLFNYDNSVGKGTFRFDDGDKHKIEFKVYDVKGNTSILKFTVTSTKPIQHVEKPFEAHFEYDESNSFETDFCEVSLPKGSLFTDINFQFSEDKAYKGGYSSIFKIHNRLAPLRKEMRISLKASSLPEYLRDKALIASIDTKTWKKTSIGGEYSWGRVVAATRLFGNYCIAVDTIAPKILPLSIKDKNMLTEPKQVRFKIHDDFSGISTYDGYIDDKWVLFEYDAKNSLVVYRFDEHIQKGKKHEIRLVVTDLKKNISKYSATFYW